MSADRRGMQPWRWLPPALLFAAAIISIGLPADWLRPLDFIGSAVCHRIAERSFFAAGRQLPLCARDTGMFSTALLGLLYFGLTLRQPAADPPRRPFIFFFVAFFLAWAFDGFNSYWVLLTDQTLFYPPQNWLRLTTGAGMGLALCSFAVILANQVLWPAPAHMPLVASWREFLRLLLLPASVIAVVLWRPDPLYGPLAVISSAGVLVMLTLANSLLAVITLRRQGQINCLGQLGLPALLGLLLTLAQITVLNLLRAALLGL